MPDFFRSRLKARRFALETERLLLRLPRRSDWKSWAEARVASANSLREVEPDWPEHLHSNVTFIASRRQAHRLYRDSRAIRCLVIEKSSDSVIGGVSLNRLEWGAKRAGLLSYWLAESHQQQGFMTEALTATMAHAFGELALNRIEAEVLPDNRASCALLEKLFFKREGLAVRAIKIRGEWRDHQRFALLQVLQGK